MKFLRVKPPNHNWRWGFYQFRWEGRCVAIGFRFPFSTLDLRLWFANARPHGERVSDTVQDVVGTSERKDGGK
jgi:hypothetical protein